MFAIIDKVIVTTNAGRIDRHARHRINHNQAV
jgi:hypothetical protein